MNYTLMEFWAHLDQAKKESLEFQKVKNSFKTEREEQAFSAAFSDGARQATNLLKLHGGLKFKD